MRPIGSKNRPGVLSKRFTKDRKRQYCAELEMHGEAPLAREVVGVSYGTVRNHRHRDPAFAEMENEAMDRYRARVAAEVHRRAVEGWEEPVYQGGVLVGTRRRWSDSLLLAHAKRHMPDAYGDRVRVDRVNVDVPLGLDALNREQRDLLRKLLGSMGE